MSQIVACLFSFMSWLSEFYQKNREYKKLRVAKRSLNSIHFEIDQIGNNVFIQSFHHVEPLFEPVTKRLWLPSGRFAHAARLAVRAAPILAAALIGFPLATTFTSQPDETVGMDTRIAQSVPTWNYGIDVSMTVGNFGGAGNSQRSLIKFDISSLPSAAVISSATLSLYCTLNLSANARAVRIYRQSRLWLEGSRAGVDDAPPTGATWNRYNTTSSWQTAGGFGANDCEQTDIGSRSFSGASEGINVLKDFALTPTTKSALDLGNGWLVKSDTESSDLYAFASSSNATVGNRPLLTVIYTLPSGLRPSGIASGGHLQEMISMGKIKSGGSL